MRIRVLINYGGVNTNERRIAPGEYDTDDPALFGIADYLLKHGHAQWVASEPGVALTPELSEPHIEPDERDELPVENKPKPVKKR